MYNFKQNIFLRILLACLCILILTGCTKTVDLSNHDEKRKNIEDKYGITISYGNDKIEDKKIASYQLYSDTSELDRILDDIDQYFSKLPNGFLEELTSYNKDNKTKVNIVITQKDYLGVSFELEGTEYWLIGDGDVKMDIASDMIYSVMVHIKKSNDKDGFLNEWNNYNPTEFRYGQGSKFKKYLFGTADSENCYFITEETMDNSIDEIEGLFSTLWDDECIEEYKKNNLPKIDAKLKYICDELKRVFETVDDDAYWGRYFIGK